MLLVRMTVAGSRGILRPELGCARHQEHTAQPGCNLWCLPGEHGTMRAVYVVVTSAMHSMALRCTGEPWSSTSTSSGDLSSHAPTASTHAGTHSRHPAAMHELAGSNAGLSELERIAGGLRSRETAEPARGAGQR